MRRKNLHGAKLIITVEGAGRNVPIKTVSVFDKRTQEYWPQESIQERGITYFLDVDNMRETLNWNLNGDSSKYQFKWGQSSGGVSDGRAYVFD